MKKTIKLFQDAAKVAVLPIVKMMKLKGGGNIKKHKPSGD